MTASARTRAPKIRRLRLRLARHYLPLALISACVMLVIDQILAHGDGKLERLMVASAYLGLVLIGVALLIGPLNLLRRRPNPLSIDLRRDVGIWAGLVSLGHMLLGLQWHYPWEPWKFFFDGGAIPLRIDSFGLASYLGLGAILIMSALLAISNDRSLRRLGARRWKRLQQLAYPLLGLVTLHAIVFIPTDERSQRYTLLVAVIVGLIVVGQLVGVAVRLRRARAVGQALAAPDGSRR